ncbi:hypothetical protein [Marinomonas mediterranea]|jgi:hypothetical protein|uniref:Lipoprotein n=1 Tax=Marinomonas mediterranea (strain ATCC 700492 / JCM 21426 / NBRC 103028 / MMB-1) TaxID=717774 RepID=F2JXV7_MARM1|nr:hypothetical protein [Marinomonas mediterranea]ADZ89606.1 hypothetical protein Marme_0303 [Marinomonas mediterranea MMB-1]WCN07698.1 hypothetical protein GV055_01550 [Marinomonas mediterranea]WCN11799.1 hypothetical protein GV054_01575 [Marinomonas mediterranea]WCN15848.1 hypothetical protein GV053_01540 [Marinomonas mediterranea MMB-1]
MDIQVMRFIGVTFLSGAVLAGCGGSSSSGSEDQQTESFTGGVFKGLMRNALVEVYSVESGTVSSTPFASVSSDDNGMYRFDTSNMPDLVYVRVSGKDNELTLMQCDIAQCGSASTGSIDSDQDGVIAFGEWLTVDSSFELTGFFSSWDQADQPTVSTVTHIVARQLGTPSVALLESAYSDVKSKMGLSKPPQEIDVIDVSSAEFKEEYIDNLKVAAILESLPSGASIANKLGDIMSEENTASLPTSSEFSSYNLLVSTLELAGKMEVGDNVEAQLNEQIEVASLKENKLPINLRPPAVPSIL